MVKRKIKNIQGNSAKVYKPADRKNFKPLPFYEYQFESGRGHH